MNEINLHEIALFEGVDEKYIDEFLVSGKVINLPKGDFLFHQNEMGDCMFIVLSGKLQIMLDDKRILNTCESGALLGELCVFGQLNRSASVCAVTDSSLLKFEGEDFRIRIYSKELDALLISYNIAKVISQRLFETDSRLRQPGLL